MYMHTYNFYYISAKQVSLVYVCVCGGGEGCDCMLGLHVVLSCTRGVRNQLCVEVLYMWFNLLTQQQACQ